MLNYRYLLICMKSFKLWISLELETTRQIKSVLLITVIISYIECDSFLWQKAFWGGPMCIVMFVVWKLLVYWNLLIKDGSEDSSGLHSSKLLTGTSFDISLGFYLFLFIIVEAGKNKQIAFKCIRYVTHNRHLEKTAYLRLFYILALD